MPSEAFYKNLLELGAGIENCYESKLLPPTLVLIYSSIETAGWLHNEDPSAGSKKVFTEWVNRYLLKANSMHCTALDLYAARCGMVHTLTSDADLIDQGKARRVCYAWGNARAEDLQESINRMNKSAELVAVHIWELYNAWKRGLAAFHTELENDAPRAARVSERARKFFGHLPTLTITNFLEATGEQNEWQK